MLPTYAEAGIVLKEVVVDGARSSRASSRQPPGVWGSPCTGSRPVLQTSTPSWSGSRGRSFTCTTAPRSGTASTPRPPAIPPCLASSRYASPRIVELPPEVEVIESTRRYVFGLSGDAYGVWDRRSPTEPIEIFDGTDEGYSSAEGLFERLRALDVVARGVLPRALRATVFVAAGVWITSILVELGLYFAGSSHDLSVPFRDIQEIDLVSNRVAVAALVVLAAVALLRWERSAWVNSTQGQPFADKGEAAHNARSAPGWVVALLWVLGVAAVTWTVAGVLTRTMFRYEPAQLLVSNKGPGLGIILADTIEVTAFRVFAAAAAAFLVWWAWPKLQPLEAKQMGSSPSARRPSAPA